MDHLNNVGDREGSNTSEGEDLEGGDAAEVAPVDAIRGGAEVGAIIAEVLAGEELWGVGKGNIIDGEEILSNDNRGDEEDGARTKVEEDQGCGGQRWQRECTG